jgi:hypothetical protein
MKPLCGCHGEPMRFNKDPRYRIGGWWKCRVKENESDKKRYEELSGLAYSRRLLLNRRAVALYRRRKRTANRD